MLVLCLNANAAHCRQFRQYQAVRPPPLVTLHSQYERTLTHYKCIYVYRVGNVAYQVKGLYQEKIKENFLSELLQTLMEM